MQSTKRATALAALLLSLICVGNADVSSTNGLQTVTLDSKAGKVSVYLPSDMRAGDTISGTVVAEPKSDRDSDTISGYVLDVAGNKTTVGSGAYKWVLPAALGTGLTISLLDANGNEAASQKLNLTQPPFGITGTSGDQVPPSQAGRPLTLEGAYDPSKASAAMVNGKQVPVLCQSPRETVLMMPPDARGQCKIVLEQGGQPVQHVQTSVYSVTLSVPKTTMLRGEKTTLNVTISWPKEGRDPDACLELLISNLSPGVIRLDGGAGGAVRKEIQGAEFEGDTRTVSFPITAISNGDFSVKAEVQAGPCGHTKDVTLLEAIRKGKDAKGYFVKWKEVDWIGTCSKRKGHGGAHRYSWKKNTDKDAAEKVEHFETSEDRDARFAELEAEQKERDAKKDVD